MADINSAQAIAVCNTQIRPTADKFAQLYHAAKRILEENSALNIAALIPNTTDTVADGAVTDGRPVITGALVTSFVAGLTQYVTTLEANDNELLNIVLQIAPNPA